MRAIIVLLVLCSFEAYVEGGVGYESPDPNFKHNGYCYSHQLKAEMAKDEVKQLPGQCQIATCLEDKSVRYNICAPFAVRPPCTITEEDPSKPWPQCCPQPSCPKIVAN